MRGELLQKNVIKCSRKTATDVITTQKKGTQREREMKELGIIHKTIPKTLDNIERWQRIICKITVTQYKMYQPHI